MTRLQQIGDAVEGERIICEFRKMGGPWLTAGSSAHRAQRAVLLGLPAVCWIEKTMRAKSR